MPSDTANIKQFFKPQKKNKMDTKNKLNRAKFYTTLRQVPLAKLKPLTQAQVDGINHILDEWDASPELTDIRWLAYMLATVYHETDGTMCAINEYGKGKGRAYGRKVKHSGIAYSIPNQLYYGRGLVQLTWYENYELMGRLLKVDLLNNPDMALNPIIAVKIMFEGMTKGSSSFGDFTGKCLEMYFNKTSNDPVGARRVINGTDKASLIAGHYHDFLRCLK